MATWQRRAVGSTVVESVTAGQITTGVLNAATTITVGGADTAASTEIGQGSVRVMRPNSDGEIQPSTILGGALRDVVQIVDPDTGSTIAGFTDDGAVVGQEVVADTARIAGRKIGDPFDTDDVMWNFARGVLGSFQNSANSTPAGQSQLGVMETSAQIQGGRVYRFTFAGTLNHPDTGSNRSYVWLRYTLDGSAPHVSTALTMYGATINWPSAAGGLSQQVSVSAYFTPGPDPDLWYTFRGLIALSRASSGSVVCLYGSSWPGFLLVEDVGPVGQGGFMKQGQVSLGGGTPFGSTTPVAPPATEKREVTRTYGATWGRTWRESGSVRTDVGSTLVQGRAAVSGSTRNYSAIGFPPALGEDLAGAAVSKIVLEMYAEHWWGTSGTAIIGVHGSASLPASFEHSGALYVAGWRRGERKLVTLPAAWYPAFASGTNKGITLGGGASTASTYYGKFAGYNTSKAPKLHVTYTN